MPAPTVHTAFGVEDFRIDARFLSSVAFLCSPDKPVETSTVIGNYALSEICVSETEAGDINMYLDTLRSPGQASYVSKVIAQIHVAAEQSRNRAAAEAADAMEVEFARFKQVFFLRVRSYEVLRVDTHESIGRIVTFPDQISDDYGNNLDPHSEQGISKTTVERAKGAENLPTIYVGHAQGAAMAEICACAAGRQAIIFDGTTLSELLVHNAVQQGRVHLDALDGDAQKEWSILHYRTAASASRQDATAKVTIAAAKKIDAEEKAARDAAIAAKAADGKKNGEVKSKDEAAKEAEQQKAAENWLKKSEWNTIAGIIPAVAQTRFTRTGRYNAKALSDMILDYTASMQAAHDPYA
ncbi:hypothetical protein NESM_000172200 [Novymonas esmeraldas]|uniref:Uncharacterized protein n=1 Tax=Novymonas esmeraldas TaxID=1808958 RepID=A0AAW0F3J4_9TRYP